MTKITLAVLTALTLSTAYAVDKDGEQWDCTNSPLKIGKVNKETLTYEEVSPTRRNIMVTLKKEKKNRVKASTPTEQSDTSSSTHTPYTPSCPNTLERSPYVLERPRTDRRLTPHDSPFPIEESDKELIKKVKEIFYTPMTAASSSPEESDRKTLNPTQAALLREDTLRPKYLPSSRPREGSPMSMEELDEQDFVMIVEIQQTEEAKYQASLKLESLPLKKTSFSNIVTVMEREFPEPMTNEDPATEENRVESTTKSQEISMPTLLLPPMTQNIPFDDEVEAGSTPPAFSLPEPGRFSTLNKEKRTPPMTPRSVERTISAMTIQEILKTPIYQSIKRTESVFIERKE